MTWQGIERGRALSVGSDNLKARRSNARLNDDAHLVRSRSRATCVRIFGLVYCRVYKYVRDVGASETAWVPLSYKRVVLIYVQHIEKEGVAVNEDSEGVAVALNEDSENIGPLSDENEASTEGIGPLINDKEGRPFIEDHGPACRVEDWVSSDDNGPLNNEGSRVDIGGTDMEDSEGSEEEDKEEDPDFVDSAYEQSENECELLTKDDKAFENYVDQPEVVEDPNAPVDEDRESTDVAKSDIESLDSSSYDEDDGNQKKRKKKQPKFQEFRHETDIRNPVFNLGLRFATTNLFRKAIRNYSIVNRRMIKFKCNDRDRVRAVCAGNCK
ncbi:unnamed protein product [Prunus armeniaca]